MGAYIYITEAERVSLRKVNDKDVQELLDAALQHDKSLMISEYYQTDSKSFFSKGKPITCFNIYHECFLTNGRPAYDARHQISGSGSKEVVMSYLYGIINGSNARLNKLTQEIK